MTTQTSTNHQATAPRRPMCPACKSYDAIPVPHQEGTERKKYDPDYACLTCGTKWREEYAGA